MKDKKLSVVINKPVSEVFEFTTNPAKTPKWIDGIVSSRVDEGDLDDTFSQEVLEKLKNILEQ